MPTASVAGYSDLIEIVVTAVSILGGCMAFDSGLEAWRSLQERRYPEQTAQRINRGLAYGFELGLPISVVLSVSLLI